MFHRRKQCQRSRRKPPKTKGLGGVGLVWVIRLFGLLISQSNYRIDTSAWQFMNHLRSRSQPPLCAKFRRRKWISELRIAPALLFCPREGIFSPEKSFSLPDTAKEN